MRRCFAMAFAVCIFSQTANAAYDLQISQMFPGGPDDDHLTADWFEIVNEGDMVWDSATDGTLWYDDSSSDVSEAVQLTGVTSIPAGGSAVFVDVGDATPAYDPLAEFLSFWNPSLVGTHEGSGLGGGGDAVTLYLAPPTATTVDDLVELDREAYTDTGVLAPPPIGNGAGDSAWSVSLGGFHVAGENGAVLNAPSGGVRSAIAALPAIPEPSSLALISVALLALANRRR